MFIRASIVLAIVSISALSGCSYNKTLESNSARLSEHRNFQVNRLNLLNTCYTNATTDIRFQGCLMLQAQLQTEQGFTVTAGTSALPKTPEELLLDLTKLGIAGVLADTAMKGLQRDPLVINQREPVFIDRNNTNTTTTTTTNTTNTNTGTGTTTTP
jgi:hypothetical protein